jgi:hypothetical protein
MELAKESDEKTESQVFSWGEAEPSPLRVSHKFIRNGLGMNPKILMNPMKNRGIRGTGGDQME